MWGCGGGNAGSDGGGGGGSAAGRGGASGVAGAAGGGGAVSAGGTGGAGGVGTSGTGGGGDAGTAGTGGGAGSAGAGGTGGSAGSAGGTGGGAGSAGASGTGGGAGTAGASGGAGGAVMPPAWDWVSVVGTGQSLAVGGHGNLPAQPFGGMTQRFRNLKLSLGSANVPPYDPMASALTMVALVEPLRAIAAGYPSPYPRNIYGQTYHTAMADEITTLAMAATGRDYITVHTEVGEAGQAFPIIKKGATDTGSTGRAYAASLFEVAAIARLARTAGKSHGVGAVAIIHGESDATSTTYEADLIKLASDYNQDLRPLTGQTTTIPLLVSQQHSSPTTAGSRSTATLAQWHAGVTRPADIVCVGPKYQYPYISDATHLTNPGYERLGEKLGQVFAERVVRGRDWRPLEPTTVAVSGRVVTVTFHVPVPPLAWDTVLPAPHQSAYTEWSQGRGFELRNGNTRIQVSAVAISGDTVQITSATDLPASGVVVGYAFTADGTIRSGGTAHWGLLRDSDPFVGSVTGAAQPNYAVAFELDVP